MRQARPKTGEIYINQIWQAGNEYTVFVPVMPMAIWTEISSPSPQGPTVQGKLWDATTPQQPSFQPSVALVERELEPRFISTS